MFRLASNRWLKLTANCVFNYVKSLGTIQAVTLVERTTRGDEQVYRYRMTYPRHSVLLMVVRNKDGKIMSLEGMEE